jgi:hypothetical protein
VSQISGAPRPGPAQGTLEQRPFIMPSPGITLTIGSAPVPHSTLLQPFATRRDMATDEFCDSIHLDRAWQVSSLLRARICAIARVVWICFKWVTNWIQIIDIRMLSTSRSPLHGAGY